MTNKIEPFNFTKDSPKAQYLNSIGNNMTEISREQLTQRVFQLEAMLKLERSVSEKVEAEALDLKVLNASFLRLAEARINKLAKDNGELFAENVELKFAIKSSKSDDL